MRPHNKARLALRWDTQPSAALQAGRPSLRRYTKILMTPIGRATILISLAASLCACIGTKAGGYRVFDEDLQRLIGTPYSDAYVFNLGYLKDILPKKVAGLSHDKEVRKFSFQHSEGNGAGVCSVYIVTDRGTGTIVEASSGGNGCWRVY